MDHRFGLSKNLRTPSMRYAFIAPRSSLAAPFCTFVAARCSLAALCMRLLAHAVPSTIKWKSALVHG
jgi:hypothetical protein